MLIKFRDVSLRLGAKTLLDNVNITINQGDRLCLLGRNGEGKSSLLKLLTAELDCDQGDIEKKQGLIVSSLPQTVPLEIPGTVFEILANSVGKKGEVLCAYHTALVNNDELGIDKYQHQLNELDAWQLENTIKTLTSKLHLNEDELFNELSGGWRRRVLLAKALLSDPDVLILDEPTNHLDLDSIIWLEKFLVQMHKTLLFVSHDRRFVEKVATRFVELENAKLNEFTPNFDKYLEEKQALHEAQALQEHNLKKKLQLEEHWMRHGISARRKRNQGRVRALKNLRQEVDAQLKSKEVSLHFSEAQKSGKLVIAASNICHSYESKPLIENFSVRIIRGEKIGVIGPNGCGKTTLLKILLGELSPDSGVVEHGTKLKIAYLDQLRDKIDLEKTVLENVAMGQTHIELDDKKVHAMSYLSDFLFSPQKAMQKVKILSGGERARLLIAKLFTTPANVLVFDEPTNDLDLETLELLEALLVDFKGTVLIVSHDREFLNRVTTSNIVFSENAKLEYFIGSYDDCVLQGSHVNKKDDKPKNTAQTKPKATKLSYKQVRELETLPQKIEQLESEIKSLNDEMAGTSFYQQDQATVKQKQLHLQNCTNMLEQHYKKWEQFDALS